MKKLLGLVAAVGMSCLAPEIASATVINFGFETDGTVTQSQTNCGFFCLQADTNGTVTSLDAPGGTASWTLSGYMQFAPFQSSDVTGGWSFVDTTGNNNLSGTFSVDYNNGIKAYYDITGGTGLFAGASGSGTSSVISITKWYSDVGELLGVKNHEEGNMNVDTPTAVIEPSTTGLATLGLALVGFAAFRRKRVGVMRG
jgi:hypothetical protein